MTPINKPNISLKVIFPVDRYREKVYNHALIFHGVLIMTRISKQAERRAVSRRRHKMPAKKTGPKRDNLAQGFRVHENAAAEAELRFVPKIS